MQTPITTPHGLAILGGSLLLALTLITNAGRSFSDISTFIADNVPAHSQLAQVSGAGSGLVAHYTFDEGSGTTAADSSGSGNTGTLQGANGLPTWTTGKVGSGALQFDGVDDRVVVASPTNAAFTTTLTLSAWIKTTDTSGRIVARTDGLAYGYTLSIGDTASDGKARIWLDKDAGVGSFDAVRSSDSAVNDGSWHHIAGVYDGPSGRLDLYVDGVASAASIVGAVPASIVAQTRPLYVAADNSCSQSKYCLEGSVDDVRVYSRALSNNDIQDIYTYTAPTQSQPPATQDQTPAVDPIQVIVPAVTPPTIAPPPPGTTDWYVSPTGTSAGNGTLANPWDLQTALTDNTDSASKNFVVKSGHTIWLRGGVYTPLSGSTFNSALTGAAGNNISVRPYQGEHAIIQGGILQFKSGRVTGNVTYRDLEITGSETISAKRISTQTSSFSFPTDIPRAEGISVNQAPGVKIINNLIHDVVGDGIYVNDQSPGVEIYGNILYHNGWDATDRTHGHNMYLQNAGASMIVKNNVSIASLNNCVQVYGSNASLRNVTFDGNIMLNCDVVIGGGTPASGMKFINNIMGENSAARFYFANQSNEDLVVTGNHFLESSQAFWWKSLAITGNYFYKGFEIRTQADGDISGYQAHGNTYYLSPILKVGSATNYSYVDYCPTYSLPCIFAAWQSKGFDGQGVYKGALPTSPTVLIRSNQYDSNRFHIAVMNWAQANNVPVDVRSILGVGDSYEIRDVQNFRGAPVLSGKYTGGDISVPMNLSTVDPYKGDFTGAYHTYAIGHTSSKFNTFVLIRTASGGASPLPSIPPQQTQPTIQPPVIPPTPTIVPLTPTTPPAPVTQPAPLTNPIANTLNKTTNTIPPTSKQTSSLSNTKLPTSSTLKTSSSSSAISHPDLPIPTDLEPLPEFRELSLGQYIVSLLKYLFQRLIWGVKYIFHISPITYVDRNLSNLSTFIADNVPAHSQLAQVSGAGSGLVAHYTFDEGSGTTAGDTAGSNAATLVNFPADNTGWVDGYFGKALKYNGSNTYVNVPKILANKSQFTVSMRSRFSGATDFQGALMGHSDGGFYIRKAGTCNSIIAWVVNSTNVGVSLNGSPGGIACDVWQMHTFTMQADGTLSYYLDGQFVKSAKHPSWDFFNAGYDNRIGQYARSAGYTWNGSIDDVYFYDRALSASEVTELYNQGTPNEVIQTVSIDREAPSAPAHLVATSISATQNNLSWDAAIDNVGVTGYKVYRGASEIGTTSSTVFQDTKVPPDATSVYTTTTYTVAAFDAQNNISTRSISASATYQTVATSSTATQQSSNGLILGTNLKIDNLGSPLNGNTQEHQIMYKTNDGHRHLQMYYDTFGAMPIDVVDIDLENAKVIKSSLEKNVGRPGTRCHIFYPANNKMYIGSSDPGSMSEFDPMTGATRYIGVVKYKGAYHCEVGEDGWIYIGEISSNVAKGAGLERYHPITNTWQDLGVIDPTFNGALQYAYTLGADDRYVYISLGQLPWYLAVYDTQAVSNKIKIYFADQADTSGQISKGTDGKWYYVKSHVGQTPYTRKYRFDNGLPVEVSTTPTLSQYYQQSNVISDKAVFKQIFNTEINLDKANPNSENNGSVEIGWKIDSNAWQYATVSGVSLVPRIIKRLYPWPGTTDTFLGWAAEYGLVFLYNSSTRTLQSLGYPTRSLYDAVISGATVYFSGYTAITMRYDSSKPWTLSASTLDAKSTSINPYILGGQFGKYHYYSTLGSDGMLYIASHHERSSTGGELAWYNLNTGISSSLREPFLDYDVSDLKSALGGTKLVYSTSKDKLFVFDVATKKIEREITPIPGNMEIDKVFETEPGIIFGIYDTKYFKVNILTGETIYIKDLGGKAFPGIPAYDRRLVKGPDGYAWLFIDGNLSRINPADGTIQRIMTAPVSSIIFSGNDLYFYGGTTVSVIRNILIGEIKSTQLVMLPVVTREVITPVSDPCTISPSTCFVQPLTPPPYVPALQSATSVPAVPPLRAVVPYVSPLARVTQGTNTQSANTPSRSSGSSPSPVKYVKNTTTYPDLPTPPEIVPLPPFSQLSLWEYISLLAKNTLNIIVRGVRVVFHLKSAY